MNIPEPQPAARHGFRERYMEHLSLDLIIPCQEQPRKTFHQQSLEELAQSIKERGVLQPIVVRPIGDGTYQIVMGERRYRASKLAGLTEIPAIIKEMSDSETRVDALLENFQREDLNPIERARAVKDLLNFMSWSQVSKTLGASETTLRRHLELLELPESIQDELISASEPGDGGFGEGHARLLKAFSDNSAVQLRLAKKIRSERLSIEDSGKLISAMQSVPAKQEAFLRVPLNVTEEILRHIGKQEERKKPFKPQTAENHLKSVFRAAADMADLLDDRLPDFLSAAQMNQLLSAVSDLWEKLDKYGRDLRVGLQKSDHGFKEVYIHCPLCGRMELVGSLRCGVCWTVLRRCADCGNYDHMYQRCAKSAQYVYASDAEGPDENSPSYKCENYVPKFEARKAA
jgi:ParB family transcriptional regulator, chromosome partitioning protein